MRMLIQKWGNSLALRIPRAFAEEARLGQGTEVNVSLVDGKLVVAPAVEPSLTLADLLAEVTEDNLHREVDTGPATGREAW